MLLGVTRDVRSKQKHKDFDLLGILAVSVNASALIWELRQLSAASSAEPLLMLTRDDGIADFSVAAHVSVQGLHPDHLGACRRLPGDVSLVARREEGRGVVVAVLHINHHFCKVPLHGDLLVAHLRKTSKAQR